MLSDAIASLGASSYVRRQRANNGTDGHGRAAAPTVTNTTITGMLQPMSGREVERLPEGLHAKETRAFWTVASLVVADEATNTLGDHIVDGPVEWEVVMHEGWAALGSPYNRYVLSRVQ